MRNIMLLFLLTFLIWSCETDFDVNAPWKDATIVYGLLEANKDTQYVKIYRAFLGNEDQGALDLALLPDQIYYDTSEVSVFMTPYQMDGNTVEYLGAPVELKQIVLSDLNTDGVFATSPNLAYYFNGPINDDYSYELKIYKQDTITAKTRIVKNEDVSFSDGIINFIGSNDSIRQVPIYYNEISNGVAYSVEACFLYEESYNNSFTGYSTDSIQWVIQKWDNTEFNSDRNIIFDGESFFNTISSSISVDAAVQRKAHHVKLIFTVGGEELYEYVQYSEPTFTVLLEKPEFEGNVLDGYGVFSSRIKTSILRTIDPETKQRLVVDPRTTDLNFINTD